MQCPINIIYIQIIKECKTVDNMRVINILLSDINVLFRIKILKS